jgi:peptidoglycan/LPS O-acetylase OafA/YrhL
VTAGPGRADAATTSSPTPAGAGGGRRIAALDGLRGIVIVLVVLGHGNGNLWPVDLVLPVPVLGGFFGGGAVSLLFVIGAVIVTRGLLRERELGVIDPLRFYARRLVRLGVQLVPFAAAVLVIHRLDATDTTTAQTTNQSVLNVLAFTWNVYTEQHPLEARPDFFHLWYLSVQQQAYLVLPLLVVVLAARRRTLAALLGVLFVTVTVWRFHVFATDGWLVAHSATSTRADGLVLGVLVAVALPWLAPLRRHAGLVLSVSAGALLVLVGVLQQLPVFQYLLTWGVVFTVVGGVLVAAIFLDPGPTRTAGVLCSRPLGYLGRASLAIFIWHLPVFALVARHTTGWQWPTRTLVAVALLSLVVWTTHRWVEEPTRRWLANHLQPTSVPTPAVPRPAVLPTSAVAP